MKTIASSSMNNGQYEKRCAFRWNRFITTGAKLGLGGPCCQAKYPSRPELGRPLAIRKNPNLKNVIRGRRGLCLVRIKGIGRNNSMKDGWICVESLAKITGWKNCLGGWGACNSLSLLDTALKQEDSFGLARLNSTITSTGGTTFWSNWKSVSGEARCDWSKYFFFIIGPNLIRIYQAAVCQQLLALGRRWASANLEGYSTGRQTTLRNVDAIKTKHGVRLCVKYLFVSLLEHVQSRFAKRGTPVRSRRHATSRKKHWWITREPKPTISPFGVKVNIDERSCLMSYQASTTRWNLEPSKNPEFQCFLWGPRNPVNAFV